MHKNKNIALDGFENDRDYARNAKIRSGINIVTKRRLDNVVWLSFSISVINMFTKKSGKQKKPFVKMAGVYRIRLLYTS